MTPYEELGGDEVLHRLVDRFYHHMQTLPEAATVLAMHPDLERANERLYDFLSGWLGGPQRYVEKHGHPRLRARHLPFVIGTPEANAWMLCMETALAEVVEDELLRVRVHKALEHLAGHMRNQPEA